MLWLWYDNVSRNEEIPVSTSAHGGAEGGEFRPGLHGGLPADLPPDQGHRGEYDVGVVCGIRLVELVVLRLLSVDNPDIVGATWVWVFLLLLNS